MNTHVDVLLTTSMREGFGIPLVEAQAFGTPVIMTDFASMPGLCAGEWLCRRRTVSG